MSPTASDTSASTGLSVRGLAVTYGDLRAVDGVDLEVAAGEVVALLGASGSGKSSLLRAVAGLEDVAGGEVAWDERSMVRVPVHKRGFGLMFQDGQLFEHRDVGSNIAYGLTGLPRAQRSERVREMLELVGLPGFERRRVTTLSGGQAQRVALARALLTEAPTLVLIEPTPALDSPTEARVAAQVHRARAGRTTVVVTASPLVLEACDEVVLLDSSGTELLRSTHRELMAMARDGHAQAADYRAVVSRAMGEDAEVSC